MTSRPGGARLERLWIYALAALPAWAVLALAVAPLRGHLLDGVTLLAALAALAWALAALRGEGLRRWVPPATAEGLGAIRAWVAAILLASVLWEDLASTAYLPRGMLQFPGQWLVKLLHDLPIGFDRFLASAPALQAFETAAALLLAMAMVGFFTRWTVPAAAVAYLLFASILRSYAWGYHTGLVPLYCLLLLSFTPCGDGLSADRWLRRRRGRPVPPAREPRMRYGLGRYLVWAAIALPYTLAGLSKLRNGGFLWWRGDFMEHRLMVALLEPMHFDFQVTYLLIRGPTWIFGILGTAALLGEILFVAVLVSALARKILPLVTAGMHVGILLLQNILFPDLIAIQAVFYDWTPLRRRVSAWMGRVRGGVDRLATPNPTPALASATTAVSPSRREAMVLRGFLVLAFLAWATRTEKFPLTAMQMFSRSRAPEPVEYVRPLVRYEDGTVEPARFERWIGAVADSRYRWLLRDWEKEPERIALLRDFLDACAARAEAARGKRIREFRLEVRRWDYVHHPADPARGELLYVVSHTPRPTGVATR